MAFGQGLDATMIQVSSAFSAVINGGRYYKPTIIDGQMKDGVYVPNAAPKPLATGVVKPSTGRDIKIMTHVARASAFGYTDKPGYYIGGKTGTSQVIVNGQYSNTETVGTYLGYGGGDHTEYVIMVRVSGKNKILQGAYHALPIFTEMSNWLIDYLKIPPRG
jgi:cell division protein FtsI/penicillin-binding protein 2